MKATICWGLLLACLAVPAHGWFEKPSAGEPSTASAAEIERGNRLYREGATEEAYTLLQRALFRDPDHPANSTAYHTLARIFLDRDQPDRALAILSRVPERDRTDVTKVLRGNALLKSGALEEGLAVLTPISPEALPQGDRFLFFEALAEGKARQRKTLEALFFYYAAASLATRSQDNNRILDGVSRIGEKIAGSPLSREARFMFQGTAAGQVLALREAEKALREGRNGEALGLIQPVLESRIDFPARAAAAELYQRITGAPWERRHTIGVLLPLSGNYASFGKMVRRGMELALEAFRQEGKGGIRFLFRDTASDVARTVAALRELVHREKVTALLGPLSGAAAEAAARLAQQEQVPLLALTPRAGIPDIGPFVFRVSLTGEAQVKTLIRHAAGEQGLTRFAVLYPADVMGREFAELFSSQVIAAGGEVVASRAYRPNAVDFREPILLLLGRDPAEPLPLSRTTEGLPENPEPALPELPFQALFIPDYGERVGLLAAQLPYYDITGVQLLGINSWNSPELIRRGQGAVEGAVFTEGFFPESPRPEVRDFVKRFRDQFRETPSILDAQGYEAALLYLKLLENPQLRTREEFRLALSETRDFPGLAGLLSFKENGEAEKTLFLLRILKGAVEPFN